MTQSLNLAAANPVLATIAPGWSFTHDARCRLTLTHCDGSFPVRLRASDRLWFVRPSRFRYFGGTTEQAICQLVLWLRGEPRRPLRWWECACSPAVRLGDPVLTVELLRSNGYADPAKTCCVLCGGDRPSDWWSLGGVVGPCCFGGRCRAEYDVLTRKDGTHG